MSFSKTASRLSFGGGSVVEEIYTGSDAEIATSVPTVGKRDHHAVVVMLLRVLTIAVIIGLWQVTSGHLFPSYAISKPWPVAKGVWTYVSTSAGWSAIGVTSEEVALGFVLGVAIGTVLGVVLGTFRTLGRIWEPLIGAFNGIPKIALAPLFLIFFGIGIWSKIALGITMVSFVMFNNLYIGMRDIRRELVEVIRVMGGRPKHVLTYVTLPSLISSFVAGLRAGGPLAILGVIAGEFIASFNGVGHNLVTASNDLDASGVFAAIIVLVCMSLILNAALGQLDQYVMRRMGTGARKVEKLVLDPEEVGELHA